MDLIFYTFSKRINSTKQPTISSTAHHTFENVRLKEPTSMTDPTFIVSHIDDIEDYNYVAWDDRYYFIREIVYLTNALVEISCSMDYLATYKNIIGSSTQYITRSDNENFQIFNYGITDLKYPVQPQYNTLSVNSSTSVFSRQGMYILGLICDNIEHALLTRGAVKYVALNLDQLNTLMGELFNLTGTSGDIDPLQYISSLIWLPHNYVESVWETESDPIVKIGPFELVDFEYSYKSNFLGQNNLFLLYNGSPFTCPTHPDAGTGQHVFEHLYLNFAPYIKYTVYGGPFGEFALEPNDVSGKTLYAKIYVDIITGSGLLNIYRNYADWTNDKPFQKQYGQVGLSVELAQVKKLGVKSVTSSIMGFLGGLVDIFTGRWLSAATNVVGGASAAYNSALPNQASAGQNDSLISYEYNDLKLVTEYIEISDYNSNLYGELVCSNFQINTAPSGSYIEIEKPLLTSAAPQSHVEAIYSLMQSGFYWE